jgi:hypothetical protein
MSRWADGTDLAGNRGGPRAAVAPALSRRGVYPFNEAVDVEGLSGNAGRRLAGEQDDLSLSAR